MRFEIHMKKKYGKFVCVVSVCKINLNNFISVGQNCVDIVLLGKIYAGTCFIKKTSLKNTCD